MRSIAIVLCALSSLTFGCGSSSGSGPADQGGTTRDHGANNKEVASEDSIAPGSSRPTRNGILKATDYEVLIDRILPEGLNVTTADSETLSTRLLEGAELLEKFEAAWSRKPLGSMTLEDSPVAGVGDQCNLLDKDSAFYMFYPSRFNILSSVSSDLKDGVDGRFGFDSKRDRKRINDLPTFASLGYVETDVREDVKVTDNTSYYVGISDGWVILGITRLAWDESVHEFHDERAENCVSAVNRVTLEYRGACSDARWFVHSYDMGASGWIVDINLTESSFTERLVEGAFRQEVSVEYSGRHNLFGGLKEKRIYQQTGPNSMNVDLDFSQSTIAPILLNVVHKIIRAKASLSIADLQNVDSSCTITALEQTPTI